MRRWLLPIALVAALALLVVLVFMSRGVQQPSAPVSATTHCHARGDLPDPRCTPGVADPRITQANIGTTICKTGYTATVRPPETYTETLKRMQIQQYGYADQNLNAYEEDHLIPLELGGHPTDPRNLWPEPIGPARDKDLVENTLHLDVCAGRLSLGEAQRAIAGNWRTAGA